MSTSCEDAIQIALELIARGSASHGPRPQHVSTGLRLLDDAFFADGTLEYALHAVDRGCVTRLETPCGRSVFTVASTLSRKPATTHAFDMAQSGIRDRAFYVVLSRSCSCAEYTDRLLSDKLRNHSFCKHLLALHLALVICNEPAPKNRPRRCDLKDFQEVFLLSRLSSLFCKAESRVFCRSCICRH